MATEPMTTEQLIGVENVRRLTDKHIQRYSSMLDSGSKFVNVSQASIYLAIWRDIEEHAWVWSALPMGYKNEIKDAIHDETGKWLPKEVM